MAARRELHRLRQGRPERWARQRPLVRITKESVAKKNTEGGEANVSDGFHAIEFLLWGQDTDEPSAKTAGRRPFTDYTTAANADRRKAYLSAVTDLVVDDIQKLVTAWAPKQTTRKTSARRRDEGGHEHA